MRSKNPERGTKNAEPRAIMAPMCGRYSLNQTGQIPLVFEISDIRLPPRFNIAPTQQAPVIHLREGDRRLELFHWGLVPFWAKDAAIGARMINARSETADEKPAFRAAFRKRRCLVPADGFFEWRKLGKYKQPYYFYLKRRIPFAFAGLYEEWNQDGPRLDSFTILTCDPNETVSAIHNRMPVILPPERYSDWLDPHADPGLLKSILRPFDPGQMDAHPVSRIVNNPSNDSPECIEEVTLEDDNPASERLEG